ncbi:MAG: hypothetical protein QM723_05695 [Myxococcaceae bacterium]
MAFAVCISACQCAELPNLKFKCESNCDGGATGGGTATGGGSSTGGGSAIGGGSATGGGGSAIGGGSATGGGGSAIGGGAAAGGGSATGGGGSATGGGGSATGGGAATGGGSATGGGGSGTLSDAGICLDWACVQANWHPNFQTGTPGGGTFVTIDAGVAPGNSGMLAWFGGVLLPDGTVLAIPHRAKQAMLIDPSTSQTLKFGNELTDPNDRKWAGGVLGPDGKVYAAPYEANQILQLDPQTQATTLVGPYMRDLIDAGTFDPPPLYVGGALDAYGTIWFVSESISPVYPIVRFDPATQAVQTFSALPGGWWGLARLPNDHLLSFPKESGFDVALEIAPDATFTSATITLRQDLMSAGVGAGMFGPTINHEGLVFSLPVYQGGLAAYYDSSTDSFHPYPLPMEGLGMFGTHGNGDLYPSPDEASVVVEVLPDAGYYSTTNPFAPNVMRYGFMGFVATPQGMVAIPCNYPVVYLFTPGVPEPRPMSVLLSPWFNKL